MKRNAETGKNERQNGADMPAPSKTREQIQKDLDARIREIGDKEVKRYDPNSGTGRPTKRGKWVKHADHERTMEMAICYAYAYHDSMSHAEWAEAWWQATLASSQKKLAEQTAQNETLRKELTERMNAECPKDAEMERVFMLLKQSMPGEKVSVDRSDLTKIYFRANSICPSEYLCPSGALVDARALRFEEHGGKDGGGRFTMTPKGTVWLRALRNVQENGGSASLEQVNADDLTADAKNSSTLPGKIKRLRGLLGTLERMRGTKINEQIARKQLMEALDQQTIAELLEAAERGSTT